MEKITFGAQLRTTQGKAVKKLRAQRLAPANITTPDNSSVAITVGTAQFNKLATTAGDTSLIHLKVEGEKNTRPVLIDDVQRNVLTGELLHVVFRQVNLKEKIKAEVPVIVVGESTLPDTVIITVHDSIEVEALPTDLPEKFTIDASTLTEIGQSITFNDLSFDRSKVTLTVGEEEMSTPIVMLQEVKQEVEEEAPAPAEGDAAAPEAAPAVEPADKS